MGGSTPVKTIRPLTATIIAVARSWEMTVLHGIEIPVRILVRVTVDPETGCWRCGGWNSGNGYANIGILGRTIKVHRLMYHLVIGEIPDGHVADHDKEKGCRYRDCIHPQHMTPVTVQHNTHKGAAKLFSSAIYKDEMNAKDENALI